ncbi:hypothetical protein G6F68_009092 [Rhizopus microsporus]|nr:hypothetical protein G6F68_009092 [Rhizopus microsporus]
MAGSLWNVRRSALDGVAGSVLALPASRAMGEMLSAPATGCRRVKRAAAAHETAAEHADRPSARRALPGRPQPTQQQLQRGRRLRQARIAILAFGNPERRLGQAAVDQRRQRLRIHRRHHALRDQPFDQALHRLHAVPLRFRRGAPQHRARITQHDALDLWFQRHLQVGAAALHEAVPGVVGTVADRLQAPIGLGIELADYRRQQAFLVAEVVIERTPGQPGLGGQVIHRGGGIAVLAEHTAGGGQQAGAGFFHLGAGAADHPELLTYAVHDYLHTERMNVASYSYALYVLSWRPVRQASRRSGDPDGHPLSRPVRCARHGRACPGRVAGPPAAADDRHRHHHPAVATARQLCAGRCGVGHLRADLRVAVAAGVALGRPVRPGTGAAVGRRGQRDRPAVAAGLHREGGAGRDAVRRGDAGRLHAQRVGDGARALDRDPSRASGVADRVLAGDGIRRGHLHRRATAVGGAGGGGVAAGRRAGGGPAACSGRGCAGAATGHRAAAAIPRRSRVAFAFSAAAGGDPSAGVADAGDGRDCRHRRHHQRGVRRAARAAAGSQCGALGLCAGQLRGRPAVRCVEAAGADAAAVAAGGSGDRPDHAATAVGRHAARVGGGGAAGRAVLRADDDRGDVAGRTARARIAAYRRHDLAAGRIEHRRCAGRGAVRVQRRCRWRAQRLRDRAGGGRRGAAGRAACLAAVGLATFSVVTTEMLPVGLLTPIAEALGASTGPAGLMISLPALLAALFAPVVVIAAGGIDRRRILWALLGLLTVANIASALAPSIGWLLAARVLVGFCMGGIWAIAGGLAARLVPAHRIGLATSIIFGGVAAASVLGVPLGALIGDALGWRCAFAAMALFSATILLLQPVVLPALPVARSVRPMQFVQQLGHRGLRQGLWLTLLLVAGHFIAFTYVRPLLMDVSGVQASWIGGLLFAYGVAGIVGNFVAGPLAARHPRGVLRAIASGLLLTPLLLLWMGGTPAGGSAGLLLWGLAYGGVSGGLMSWMMKAVPQAVEVATALYVGVFNIGIALGAWAGGRLLDSTGLHANLWAAAMLAASALLMVATTRR